MVKGNGRKKKKKILVRLLLLFFCVVIVHGMWPHYVSERRAKELLKYIEDKDAEGIYSMFCTYIKDEYPKKTKREIKEALEFIEGDVISAEYDRESGLRQSSTYSINSYFATWHESIIKTSTGKKYCIWIRYNYICKTKPQYEGLQWIEIINYHDDENKYKGEDISVGGHVRWDSDNLPIG